MRPPVLRLGSLPRPAVYQASSASHLSSPSISSSSSAMSAWAFRVSQVGSTRSFHSAPSPFRSRSFRVPISCNSPPPPSQPRPETSTPSSFFTPSLCRHASTSAPAASGDVSSAATTSSSSSPPSSTSLDWNSFFKLRTSRRRYSLASSIFGSFATTSLTVSTLTADPHLQDAIQRVIALDPMVALGGTTLAGMGAGWLIGPFFGNVAWRALHRGKLAEFMAKEKAFFERIKKHRVDPRGASANNPVPDYYGEKVGSVAAYRRWLKDQRAFNRKRGVAM